MNSTQAIQTPYCISLCSSKKVLKNQVVLEIDIKIEQFSIFNELSFQSLNTISLTFCCPSQNEKESLKAYKCP